MLEQYIGSCSEYSDAPNTLDASAPQRNLGARIDRRAVFYFRPWTTTTIAHVAMTVTVAIIVKSGIAVDFADFAITIPSFPTMVNGIHRECVLAVTALAFFANGIYRSLPSRSLSG